MESGRHLCTHGYRPHWPCEFASCLFEGHACQARADGAIALARPPTCRARRTRAGPGSTQAAAKAGRADRAAADAGAGTGLYIVGTFIFTYATPVLGAPRNFVLMAVMTQAVLGFLWVPVAGHLSDQTPRGGAEYR
jgi:hypothetical protein